MFRHSLGEVMGSDGRGKPARLRGRGVLEGSLTPMEQRVCSEMMFADRGAKEVARVLGIAVSTVNEHLANARRKTGHKTTMSMLLWMQRQRIAVMDATGRNATATDTLDLANAFADRKGVPNHFFGSTFEKMQRAGTEREVLDVWLASVRFLGLQKEMYGIWDAKPRGEVGRILSVGYSDSWMADCAEGLSANDPVLRHAASCPTPFDWRDCPIKHPAEKEFMNLAAEAEGLRYGISAAIPSGLGTYGAFSLASDRDCGIQRLLAPVYAISCAMHMTLQYMHRDQAKQSYLLTQTELEVLRWQRDGKSDSEIADNLGLPEAAIREISKACCLKLGVRNSTMAVTKALSLSLISL